MSERWKFVLRLVATIVVTAIVSSGCGSGFSSDVGVTVDSQTRTPVAQPTTTQVPSAAPRYTSPPAYIPPPPAVATWPSSAVWMRPARSLDNLPSNVIHAFNENGSVALTCAGKDSSRRAYGSDKVRGYDFELIDFDGTPPGQVTLRFYTDTRGFDDLTVILTTSNVPGNETSHQGGDSAVVITAADFNVSNSVVIDSSKYNPDKFAYPMVTDVRACT